jgi:hypothetical protein
VLHVRASHAHRRGVLHDQPPTLPLAAQRAGELTERRDDHQLRRATLALSQPRALLLRQLRGDPIRAIRPLNRGIARLGEPQRPAIPRPRKVSGLTRPQAARLRPPAKRAHRRRDLPQVRDRDLLEILDAALAPLINPTRLEPADADQHVDRGHELALRKRRLGRTDHPAIDVPAIAGHVQRKLHTTPATEHLTTATARRV